jgi:hypothetical protein
MPGGDGQRSEAMASKKKPPVCWEAMGQMKEKSDPAAAGIGC